MVGVAKQKWDLLRRNLDLEIWTILLDAIVKMEISSFASHENWLDLVPVLE